MRKILARLCGESSQLVVTYLNVLIESDLRVFEAPRSSRRLNERSTPELDEFVVAEIHRLWVWSDERLDERNEHAGNWK